jgi:hypothetical protein
MRKKGKSLLGKLIGSGGSCGCCCGSNIVSVRKIEIAGQNVDVSGLDEEFKKRWAAGISPKDVDGDELIRSLSEIDEIPESEKGEYKEAFLREYRVYWQENIK